MAHDIFLTTSKTCGVRAKKKVLRTEKKVWVFFLAQNVFLGWNIFVVRIIFFS